MNTPQPTSAPQPDPDQLACAAQWSTGFFAGPEQFDAFWALSPADQIATLQNQLKMNLPDTERAHIEILLQKIRADHLRKVLPQILTALQANLTAQNTPENPEN